jgi:uncharacterized membrane protein
MTADRGLLYWVDRGAFAIEALAVVMIISFILVSTAIWLYHLIAGHQPRLEYYRFYRYQLARSLLVGLEILVAADIVRTVALDTTFATLLELGLLVLIRTFLSWSIVVELEGQWPWQSRAQGLKGSQSGIAQGSPDRGATK